MALNVLVLNFFPTINPPTSGGELRYFHFYKELSEYFHVTLLSYGHTYHDNKIRYSDSFQEIRVSYDEIYLKCYEYLEKKAIGPVSALAFALSSGYPSRFVQQYKGLYPYYDLIIHEGPYTLGFDRYFGYDKKPRIYNSHNFESTLVRSIWSGKHANKYISYITNLERILARKANLIFATCEAERQKFINLFQIPKKKVRLAPNGITGKWLKRKGNTQKEIKKAFFIGSNHPPNFEAVHFITHELAEQCPEVQFIIAGKCGIPFSHIQKGNIEWVDQVDEGLKLELFSTADIAINPMFSGAGTNIKTLEYLSAGLPLISTRVGARGLGLMDQIHYIQAEKYDFASKLKVLANDEIEVDKITQEGQRYVNRYFLWRNIAKKARDEIMRVV